MLNVESDDFGGVLSGPGLDRRQQEPIHGFLALGRHGLADENPVQGNQIRTGSASVACSVTRGNRSSPPANRCPRAEASLLPVVFRMRHEALDLDVGQGRRARRRSSRRTNSPFPFRASCHAWPAPAVRPVDGGAACRKEFEHAGPLSQPEVTRILPPISRAARRCHRRLRSTARSAPSRLDLKKHLHKIEFFSPQTAGRLLGHC